MRGLGLIVGYVLGNATARKWCIDKLKKASVVIDKEMKNTPLGKVFCSITPDEKNKTKEKDNG